MTMTAIAALTLILAILAAWMAIDLPRAAIARRARNQMLSRSIARFHSIERQVFGEPQP